MLLAPILFSIPLYKWDAGEWWCSDRVLNGTALNVRPLLIPLFLPTATAVGTHLALHNSPPCRRSVERYRCWPRVLCLPPGGSLCLLVSLPPMQTCASIHVTHVATERPNQAPIFWKQICAALNTSLALRNIQNLVIGALFHGCSSIFFLFLSTVFYIWFYQFHVSTWTDLFE